MVRFSSVVLMFIFFSCNTKDSGSYEEWKIYGNEGNMSLVGYDWAPWGVDMVTKENEKSERFLPDPGTYVWQEGASKISEALLTGTEPLINAEHALHVLEVIEATRESQKSGKRINLQSKFKWPVV